MTPDLSQRYAYNMPKIRIALAQLNPIVGDLVGNSELSFNAIKESAQQGANIVVLPEMMLTGYPVEDLALRPSFQQASEEAATSLAKKLGDHGYGHLVVIVGYLRGTDSTDSMRLGVPRGAPMNCAAIISQGRVLGNYAKHHLPNYGVFDEYRYFVPGEQSVIVRAFGCDFAIAICEDLWQEGGPVSRVSELGAGALLVLNASPYERDKDDLRLSLVQRRAREAGVPLTYVNMCGGQDELVFDGDSIVVDANGEVIARSIQFHDDLLIADVDIPESTNQDLGSQALVINIDAKTTDLSDLEVVTHHDRLDSHAEVYEALVVGLHDYVEKNGFSSVLVGLSGGIDSAFVATLACDALGANRVFGVSMPSEYSSEHSQSDAADLANRTGLHYRTVPIAPMVQAYLGQLGLTGLAEENLQARVRGTTLMGISNQEGHLVLATGNKSELAVGYSTIYGDAVGGFAPIKDLPKTDVWELARWRNAQARESGEVEPIPVSSIDKPPSAELRPGQLDTDSLPDYQVLDQILSAYVEQDMTREQIVASGFDSDLVAKTLRMVDVAEYKRRQYPPGTKVSRRAFGRDRRLPMTNKWQDI